MTYTNVDVEIKMSECSIYNIQINILINYVYSYIDISFIKYWVKYHRINKLKYSILPCIKWK